MKRLSPLIVTVSLTVVFALATTEARAQIVWCGTPTPPEVPATPDPPPSCCEPLECDKCTKSPAFAASGVYATSVTDLALPTAVGSLAITRRYSSDALADGPFGAGWRSALSSRISQVSWDGDLVLVYFGPYGDDTRWEYRTTQYLAVLAENGSHHYYLGAFRSHHTDPEQVEDTYTSPLGRHDALIRNADGTFDLTREQSGTVDHFDANGLLETRTDDYGNVTRYLYDLNGRLDKIADESGSGRFFSIFWGPDGRISAISDSTGRYVEYTYDLEGHLTKFRDAEGRDTHYTYPTAYLAKVEDHWLRTTSDIGWRTAGRVGFYTENGETWTYQRDGTETRKIDSNGNTWTYPHDELGLVTADGPPGVSEFYWKRTTYNADGSIASVEDEQDVVTAYTYYANGTISSVMRDATQERIRFDYTYHPDFPDKVIAINPVNAATTGDPLHPHWQGWQYEYHALGSTAPGALHRVHRVRDDGATTDLVATYDYDARGRVVRVTDAGGGVTDYAYDASGNLWTVTAPANNDAGTRPVTTYGCDAAGRVTSVTDPMGKVTSYAYDKLDRIVSVTLPKPTAGSALDFTTTYLYDQWDAASGLVFVHVTDPNGNVTKEGYDEFGRLRTAIDALGNATRYGYTKDLLTSITDANDNVTSYEYNALRQLTATVFPDGARETYTYHWDGLLASKTDRKNQTIQYAYDRFKRLLRKTNPDATYIHYTYQGQKLTKVEDLSVSPAETHTFTYDSSFRMTSNTQGPRGTISYTYHANDAVASYNVTGGPTASYTYYPDGSLNTIAWTPVTGLFKYAYNPRGQYETVTFPNGQTRNYAYDDQGRLTQLANLHPTVGNLATYGYAYDTNHYTGLPTMLGQRVTMTADVPAQGFSGAVTQYGYDANYQLTRAAYPAGAPFNGEVHEWTYDGIGNRLTSAVDGAVSTYSYQTFAGNPKNSYRLASHPGGSASYDANGNMISSGSTTYDWTVDDRLAAAHDLGTSQFLYDYRGRRTSKTINENTTFLYAGHRALVQAGSQAVQYLFGGEIDEVFVESHGGMIRYATVDALDTVTLTSDDTGTNHYFRMFDAWGQSRSSSATSPSEIGFTGREDATSSMAFFRSRYLQSNTGRFLSEDPLRQAAGPNIYTYVDNNPILFVDPFGLKARVCCKKIPGLGPAAHCFIEAAGNTYGYHEIIGNKLQKHKLGGLLSVILPFGTAGVKDTNNPFDTPPDAQNSAVSCGPWKEQSPCNESADDCVKNAVDGMPKAGPYSNGGLKWVNSNSWAHGVAAKCGLSKPPDMWTPGWWPGLPF